MCGDCGASSVHIDVLTATSCTFTKLAQVSNALAYHSRADAASGTFSSPKGVSAWSSGNQPVAVNRSPFRSLHVSSAVSPPAVGVSRTSGLQSRLITPGHGGQSAGQPVTRSLASCRLKYTRAHGQAQSERQRETDTRCRSSARAPEPPHLAVTCGFWQNG